MGLLGWWGGSRIIVVIIVVIHSPVVLVALTDVSTPPSHVQSGAEYSDHASGTVATLIVTCYKYGGDSDHM